MENFRGELYERNFGNTEIVKGLTPFTLSNQDLKWETTSQVNVGIDLGLFKNRLTFTADFYYKKTRDLLLTCRLLLIPVMIL